MKAGITFRVDREHEARCIAAIRERNHQRALAEADFEYRPWWRPRDEDGRFLGKGRPA